MWEKIRMELKKDNPNMDLVRHFVKSFYRLYVSSNHLLSLCTLFFAAF